MKQNQQACQQRVYKVTRKDLPLCCPMPGMKLWNAHPRVFLAIDDQGQAKCEYCGTEYIVTDMQADTASTDVEYADAAN